jgi:hypothetical protein
MLLALNRFALYEWLHLPFPESSQKERECNNALLRFVDDYDPTVEIDYPEPQSMAEGSITLQVNAAEERGER